jgi:hypothetical protein
MSFVKLFLKKFHISGSVPGSFEQFRQILMHAGYSEIRFPVKGSVEIMD